MEEPAKGRSGSSGTKENRLKKFEGRCFRLYCTVLSLLCVLESSCTHRQEEHAVHPKRGVTGVEGESGEEPERQVSARMDF